MMKNFAIGYSTYPLIRTTQSSAQRRPGIWVYRIKWLAGNIGTSSRISNTVSKIDTGCPLLIGIYLQIMSAASYQFLFFQKLS